jgi:hypothetical protein
LGLVPEEPGLPDVIAQQRELLSRLRAVVEAKDAETAVLRQELDAERELRRRLELRLAELERRLSMDSTDSGTPSSKERIGAKEARRARQQSERERRKDRNRGGGHVRGAAAGRACGCRVLRGGAERGGGAAFLLRERAARARRAPLCRRHHRCKQAEGWQLAQPEPGVLIWRTPADRRYTTAPTEYPI